MMLLTIAWVEVGLSAVASAFVGLVLWAVLPRGVVLTRSARTLDWKGEPLYDTWEVKNDSALPVRIRSVTVSGAAAMFELERGRPAEVALGLEGTNGVSLQFDDEILEIGRYDRGTPWGEVVVLPGDTLQAHVLNNSDLRIRYQRGGRLGFFERRELVIHGYV